MIGQRAAVAVLEAAMWVVGRLPAPLAYALADLFAVPWCLFWAVTDRRGRRTKGYWRNIRIAFRAGAPLGAVRPRGHLWRWSRHLARVAVDFCALPRLSRGALEARSDFTAFPPLRALYEEGKGLIFATGHIGMPEVAGHAAALFGLPITSVYRPSPVPALDRLIARVRGKSGQQVIAKQNVVLALRSLLREGQVIGLLVDGGSKHNAVFAPFLGTPASTVATPAMLHLATGAPLAGVTVARIGVLRYRLHVWDVIRHPPTDDRDADVRAITVRVNDGLGRGIAAAPEQWFWQTRRFRHRPPGEVPGPDGLPPLGPS